MQIQAFKSFDSDYIIDFLTELKIKKFKILSKLVDP